MPGLKINGATPAGGKLIINGKRVLRAYYNGAQVWQATNAMLALEGIPSGFAFSGLDMSVAVKGHSADFFGDANDFLAYTSPSTKYVRNSSGIYVGGTTLRTEYDVAGDPLGLLVEGQRTNLVPNGRSIVGGSGWSNNAAPTITANALEAPDGTTSASSVTTSAINSGVFRTISVADGSTYSWSLFLKAVSGSGGVKVGSESTPAAALTFDPSTGAISSVGAGLISYGAQAVGSGWWRVWGRYTAASGSDVFLIYAADTTAKTFGAWGAQLELGAFPSSPIMTTDSTVTRAADAISKPLTAIPFNADEGTMIVEASTPWVSAPITRTYAAIDDATTSEMVRMFVRPANTFGASVHDGGVTQADLVGTGALSAGQPFKLAVAYAPNDIAFCANGGTVATDTSATLPSPTQIQLGSTFLPDGHLRSLVYIPQRLSNAQLQSLTA